MAPWRQKGLVLMKSTFHRRLKKLEDRGGLGDGGIDFRMGPLKRLPADYTGTRHIVIVSRGPGPGPRSEWIEAEERPGPAPSDTEDPIPTIFLSEADMNL